MPTYLSPGVYVEELEAGARPIEGVGTAVAAFVGFAAKGPLNTPFLVTSWSQFTETFGEFVEGAYLAQSVYGYFLNGGGISYIVRVGDDGGLSDGGPTGETQSAPQAVLGDYVVRALEGIGTSPGISVEVAPSAEEDVPEGSFRLVVRRGDEVGETYDPVTTQPGEQNVVTAVRARSRLITIEPRTQGIATTPSPQTVQLAGQVEAPPGDDVAVSADDYIGDVADRTGFSGLEAIDEITMVAVPDLMSAYQRGALDLDAVQAVQQALIAHCEQMGDRMAVLDPPPGLSAQQVLEWRTEKARYDSKYAALYYPWVRILDPAVGKPRAVPPSGHLAGVWARTDDARGVHKAPANEKVRGSIDLEMHLTRPEHDLLNPAGINCIRAFPGRGIRVWGARTLSSDPGWHYLNVRRLFNYLEESILSGTQWVVFEPNDDALWARVRRTVTAFLVNEWRRGALFGATPDEAFYVKCDSETNPAESIDAGQVICEVGVAPVKPAEFVVFRLAQVSGGTSLLSE